MVRQEADKEQVGQLDGHNQFSLENPPSKATLSMTKNHLFQECHLGD